MREVAAAIEEAARSPLRTERGEALAAERRRTMLDFARGLAREEEEFGPFRGEEPSRNS